MLATVAKGSTKKEQNHDNRISKFDSTFELERGVVYQLPHGVGQQY